MFCFWCGRPQRKVVSLREQLLRTPADRNGKPEFRSDTLLPVWLWAALDTRHILLNIQYILFPVRQLYFIKHHLQMRGSERGLLCRNLTGWTMCERRLCTLIATVKHRTNIRYIWSDSLLQQCCFPFQWANTLSSTGCHYDISSECMALCVKIVNTSIF